MQLALEDKATPKIGFRHLRGLLSVIRDHPPDQPPGRRLDRSSYPASVEAHRRKCPCGHLPAKCSAGSDLSSLPSDDRRPVLQRTQRYAPRQEGSAKAPGPRADRASAHPLPGLSPSSAHRMAANVAAPKTPNAAIWAYMVPS